MRANGHMRQRTGPRIITMLATLALVAACERGSDAEAGRSDVRVARPAGVRETAPPPARYAIGRVASAEEVRAWDIDVAADGSNLPAGRGSYAEGATLYARQCAMCHGARGEGLGQGHTGFPKLIGREPRDSFPFGKDFRHVKTVGNYWPHATTLFDYVRRAMPLNAPGTLTDSQVYALVAFLLAENEIVPKTTTMDAASLRAVRMPARERFVPDDRQGGTTLR